jgi:ribonuclease P protein component
VIRTGGPDRSFPRRLRILHGREFERIMRGGRKVYTRNLIVFAAQGEGDGPRLGLAIGRKVGKATCRNRWRRLVREAFRLKLKATLPAVDLVIAVKAAAPGKGTKHPARRVAPGLAAVQAELAEAVRRLGPPAAAGSGGGTT